MEIMRITRVIAPLLDELTNSLFRENNALFLSKPLDYIVPAVWGAKMDGALDTAQQQIHVRIQPVLEQVVTALALQQVDDAQEYAIRYIIRGYIISRIIFSVAELRHQILQRMLQAAPGEGAIQSLEPIGNA